MAEWQGVATCIDPFPMFRWPIIAEVAQATRRPDECALPPIAGPLHPVQPAVHSGQAQRLSVLTRIM
jgi:hypothetical protein